MMKRFNMDRIESYCIMLGTAMLNRNDLKFFIDIVRFKEYYHIINSKKECKSMEYITAQETADKWDVTRRYVQILCANSRIDGAKKIANLWLIPNNAVKPVDGRKSKGSLSL